VFTFWKSFWSCMLTELMNSLSYGFSVEALSKRYEMDSLSFVHEGQSLTIHNLTPNGGGIRPFQCEQTHFQGTFEVHRQMAHKWKVWVLFLQNEMDQTFQDLGKIAVTSVKVDHSKQPAQHPSSMNGEGYRWLIKKKSNPTLCLFLFNIWINDNSIWVNNIKVKNPNIKMNILFKFRVQTLCPI